MRRKTRRRKRRRRGGVGDKSAATRRERRRAARNERRRRGRFERALPKGQYPDFAKLEAEATRRAVEAEIARIPTVREVEADMERKAFLRSGQEIAMASPLRKGKQGGRQYPKSRTHVYSRATPTHNIGRTKRSKSRRSRRSRKSRRSKSRSKSRRSRSRRRRSRRSN